MKSSFESFPKPKPSKNGTDTGDANATAADILVTKNAYVRGVKIDGSMVRRTGGAFPGYERAVAAAGNSGRIHLYALPGAYIDTTVDQGGGKFGMFFDDPDFTPANIRADQNMFGLQGTMPARVSGYQGATMVASASPSPGIIDVQPYSGYWNGVVYGGITNANFIAPNIPYNLNMFGLVGSGVNAKYYASGTTTSSSSGIATVLSDGSASISSALTVSGLNFPNGIGVIIIRRLASSDWCLYQRNELWATNGLVFNGGSNQYFRLSTNVFVNTSGFQMPVNQTSLSYTWEAWGA